jgi:hypothetical protein
MAIEDYTLRKQGNITSLTPPKTRILRSRPSFWQNPWTKKLHALITFKPMWGMELGRRNFSNTSTVLPRHLNKFSMSTNHVERQRSSFLDSTFGGRGSFCLCNDNVLNQW